MAAVKYKPKLRKLMGFKRALNLVLACKVPLKSLNVGFSFKFFLKMHSQHIHSFFEPDDHPIPLQEDFCLKAKPVIGFLSSKLI